MKIFYIKLPRPINYFILFAAVILSIGLIQNSANGYAANYGGRIVYTEDILVCDDPLTCEVCIPCGCGPWYNVVFQPSGGSGPYICPESPAQKGNNPTYLPGGYLLAGGGSPYTIDINNAGSVMGKIKGNLMLAWFRFLNILS